MVISLLSSELAVVQIIAVVKLYNNKAFLNLFLCFIFFQPHKSEVNSNMLGI